MKKELLLSCAIWGSSVAFADNIKPSLVSTNTPMSAITDGHMVINNVQIYNASYVGYWLGTTNADLGINAYTNIGASFALSVEIEEHDVDVDIIAVITGGGQLRMKDSDAGTDVALATGTYTLTEGNVYTFYGSSSSGSVPPIDSFTFNVAWPETGTSGDVSMVGLQLVDQINMSVVTGSTIFSVPSTGSGGGVTIQGPGTAVLGFTGSVSSTTLTLPSSGIEGIVTVPTGNHEIEIVGAGVLWFPDGGSTSALPADVNMDGVVDIADLLAIIAAWGATTP